MRSAYLPSLFRGTELRVGRFFTPFGVESNEGVSTPLLSRSYAFNWSSPFTHCGAAAYVTFNPVWSGVFMLVNGNDVYFGGPSEELRFVGNIKWTQPGGQNTLTLGTSVGRGKFNAGAPFPAATVALTTEPNGRNNINVFDAVYTHTFNSRLNYSATVRFEAFDDFQAQRTGFEGLYTAVTGGLQFKLRKGVIIRPELRYDHNQESRPFEGKHGIFTAASDLILRW